MFDKRRPWLRSFAAEDNGGGSGQENSDPENGGGGDPKKDDTESKTDSGDDDGELQRLQKLLDETQRERDTWKGHARTWEERAKKHKNETSGDVEERLSDLEQKLQEKDQELQASRKAELVTRIASEFKLSDDDREFLPDTEDEETLRRYAERLATPKSRGAEDPFQGRGSGISSRDAIIARAKSI